MDNFLATSSDADKEKKRKTMELKLSAFVAEHTSFPAAPHLVAIAGDILNDCSPKLGRTKASMIIKNVMSPAYREDLIAKVKGKPFSLIINEATDCSMKKTLGLIIRFVDFDVSKV